MSLLPFQPVLFVPLDARPVCYDLPRMLADTAGVTLLLPPKSIWGDLKQPRDWQAFQHWLKTNITVEMPVIVALDTIAYGGLIPSRLGTESIDELNQRLQWFYEISETNQLYGFSSVMRIPNYNNDEEEPEYWSAYGKRLYQYSVRRHREGKAKLDSLPEAVLRDFLWRRQRNHQLNQGYLDAVNHNKLEQLVFCQDDTGEFGLNVQEAKLLESLVEEQNLEHKARLQTGADEVASCYLSQLILQRSVLKKPKVFVVYSNIETSNLLLRYDGVSAETLVKQKINACGAMQVRQKNDADLVLWVHTPVSGKQWDHIMDFGEIPQQAITDESLKSLLTLINSNKVIIADLAYANGADYHLGEALLNHIQPTQLYGYAAWNTGGNAMGTALAMGCVRWWAEENNCFDEGAFKQLMFTRWADDWLYQSKWRQQLRQKFTEKIPTVEQLNKLLCEDIGLLMNQFNLNDPKVQLSLPCNRLFEIAIHLKFKKVTS